ncbi:MAG: hypothetical protein RLY14_1336 [Planctomycetota bacterium]|jgi:hypothetical protein
MTSSKSQTSQSQIVNRRNGLKRTDPKSKSDRPRNDKTATAAQDANSLANAECNQSEANLPKRQTANWLKKMERIVSSDLTLQPFLEQLLPFLVTSFSAQGGLIWLRPHGGHGSWFALRHRMEPIQFAPQEAKKHELLVQFAWQQRRPLILAPKSKTAGQPRNPSDYSLAFAPVVHWGEPIALLELVMLSHNAPADIAAQRLFLQALQVASEQIQQGLRSRMNLPAATISQATHAVDSLKEEIRSYEESLRKSIEARLRQFQGWAFGSLQENQAFAKMVHELLDQHGLRVQCPECGNPAILRCLKAGNSKNGVFVFDHYLDDGRTFHGGPTAVPALTLIGKPQRRPNLGERCAS